MSNKIGTIEKLMDGYNPYRQRQEETRGLVKKWESTGLLEGLNDEQKENRLVLLERLQGNGHKRLEWEKISGNDNALQKLLSHSMPVVPSNIASSFNKRSSH